MDDAIAHYLPSTHKDHSAQLISHNNQVRVQKTQTAKLSAVGDPTTIQASYQVLYQSENFIALCDNFSLLLKTIKIARHNC